MEELTALTAGEIGRRIAAREVSSEEVVRACLERIADREDAVRAWAHLDPDRALAEALERDASTPAGPLHGVPVGIKDIIDTADQPTAYGSPIYAGHRPVADAACVRHLREAGAVVLGKTHTTEFAFFHPGPTRNPHDPGRTPGGSSSGSAAAVADAMVPLALGTQTAASTVRPAAFCGVFGFKPTFGLVSRAGVKALAPSLDTLGAFARDPVDLALLLATLAGVDPADPATQAAEPPALPEAWQRPARIAVVRTPEWPAAEPAARDALEQAARRAAAAGAEVEELTLPSSFDSAARAQTTLMEVECSVALRREYEERPEELSRRLHGIITLARELPPAAQAEARELAEACRRDLPVVFQRHDVLLTPSAPGEAPPGIEATGDPIFSRTWTLLGCPSVSVPGLRGPSGMPVGVQLVGAPSADATVLAAACTLGALLA